MEQRGSPVVLRLTNHVVNPLLVPLLRTPLGRPLGRRLAVVTYRGRRSGQVHRLVTGCTREGAQLVIRVGLPAKKTWWRNFQTPQPVSLRFAGEDHDTVAHVEQDERGVRVVAEA